MKKQLFLLLALFLSFPAFSQSEIANDKAIQSLQITPSKQLLPIGETATFRLDVEQEEELRFQWFKNEKLIEDATTATLDYPNVQLKDNEAQFQVLVSRGAEIIHRADASLFVTSNTRPYPSFLLPSTDLTFAAGDTIIFEGRASDIEDGLLKNKAFAWTIVLQDGEHIEPVAKPLKQTNRGYFVVPARSNISDNAWYRIYLEVTDSEGLSGSIFRDIFPQKAAFKVQTSPSGLSLNVDEKRFETPYTVKGVKGMERRITAPKLQKKGEKQYIFTSWSDGFDRNTIYLSTEDNLMPVTANYTEVIAGNGVGLLGRYYTTEIDYQSNQPSWTKFEPNVNFDGKRDAIKKEVMIAEWTGELQAYVSDQHRFRVASDGAVRLYVDDKLLIDEWTNSAVNASIVLTEGKSYPFYLVCRAATSAQLFWSTPDLEETLIPQTQLQPAYDEGKNLSIQHLASESEKRYVLRFSKFNEGTEAFSVRLLDTQGQTFFQEKFNLTKGTKSVAISMRYLRPSVYFLEIRGTDSKEVKKLVKKK
ncbi:MAG: PA14 domain-containing protein [Bacteroidota bacterium]